MLAKTTISTLSIVAMKCFRETFVATFLSTVGGLEPGSLLQASHRFQVMSANSTDDTYSEDAAWNLLGQVRAAVDVSAAATVQANSKLALPHDDSANRMAQRILVQVGSVKNWTAAQSTSLTTLMVELKTSYVATLTAEQTADEVQWDAAVAVHAACHNAAALRFNVGGDVHHNLQAMSRARTKHKKCARLSKAFDLFKSAAENCPTDSELVFPREPVKSTALFSRMETLRISTAEYKASLSTTSDEDMPTSCEADQQHFEDTTCHYRESSHFACLGETTCTTAVNLTDTKFLLEGKGAIRRAAKNNFLITLCKIKRILDKMDSAASSSSCDLLEVATEYTQVLPVPSSEKCGSDSQDLLPSTDANKCQSWRGQEYGAWPPQDYNIPSSCRSSCSDTPVAPTQPGVVAKCTNSGGATEAECNFFEHHHDACSSSRYNTATLQDPPGQCCFCGGGAAESIGGPGSNGGSGSCGLVKWSPQSSENVDTSVDGSASTKVDTAQQSTWSNWAFPKDDISGPVTLYWKCTEQSSLGPLLHLWNHALCSDDDPSGSFSGTTPLSFAHRTKTMTDGTTGGCIRIKCTYGHVYFEEAGIRSDNAHTWVTTGYEKAKPDEWIKVQINQDKTVTFSLGGIAKATSTIVVDFPLKIALAFDNHYPAKAEELTECGVSSR